MTTKYLIAASALVLGVATADAKPRGGSADLQLIVAGVASTLINDSNTYSVQVENIGNQRARNVTVDVSLPNTGQFLQSTVGNCALSGVVLSCDLGRIRAGGSRSIAFNFQAPNTAGTQYFTAQTQTRTAESSLSNNQDTLTTQVNDPVPPPPPSPVAVTVAPPEAFLMQSCTSTSGPLTWQDCTPSSLTQNTIILDVGGVLSGLTASGYVGSWSQNSSLTTIDAIATNSSTASQSLMTGVGVSIDCFEGTTIHQDLTFTYPDNYSAWRWCR